MSPILLESDQARIEILPRRGALISKYEIKSPTKDHILWLPDDFDTSSSAWPGGGLPFLFPFAGRVWHQGQVCNYALGDQTFPMPLHGFSWSTKWIDIQSPVSPSAPQLAILELSSDENSLQIYPFHFQIRMHIELIKQDLKVRVFITHNKPALEQHAKMPVAVGWHPYFSLSTLTNKVNIPARKTIAVTPQGGAGKTKSINDHLGQGPWPLPHQELQSLILSELKGSTSNIYRENQSLISLTAGPAEVMQHVVTWTNQPKEFHCVEPWMSLPDAVATPSGCKWLASGEQMGVWIHIQPQ